VPPVANSASVVDGILLASSSNDQLKYPSEARDMNSIMDVAPVIDFITGSIDTEAGV
jgi:hypothetical protein